VIDNVNFLKCLQEIGYDGPVTPEPFSQRVNALPPAEAARVTAEALNKVWTAAGLE
jgi:predicted xylose isomerase-like sugar epimerase